GEVKNPAIHIWPAVSDAHVKVLAVCKIDDPYDAAKRHGPVGGGQRVHIENFTVGRLSAMKLLAVPGSYPAVLYPRVKLSLSFWNPGTGARQHSRKQKGIEQCLIRSRSMVCHFQHLHCSVDLTGPRKPRR